MARVINKRNKFEYTPWTITLLWHSKLHDTTVDMCLCMYILEEGNFNE